MKAITYSLLVAAIMLSSFIAKSQDTLVMKSGLKIPSQISEITESVIRYKKASNPDGPTYVTNVSDVNMIKYRNGMMDTVKAPTAVVPATNDQVVIQQPIRSNVAPMPAAPVDPHPPIYNAGMFYRYENRKIKRDDAFYILKGVHDEEIDLHVKKARVAKGLEYTGFVAIPAFVFAAGYTGFAFLNNLDNPAGTRDYMSYGPGVGCFAVAAVALGTSITFKIVGKNHTKEAIRLYNEKY